MSYFSMTNFNDFVKVKIISKSNYRYYSNFRYLELDHPDAGAFLRPNDFWSHTLPVRRVNQEHQDVVLPEVVEDGPPELEREGGA